MIQIKACQFLYTLKVKVVKKRYFLYTNLCVKEYKKLWDLD